MPLVLSATGGIWTSRGSGIQENGISPGGERGATLLQDDPLSHPVHSWHKIGQTKARQTVSGITN